MAEKSPEIHQEACEKGQAKPAKAKPIALYYWSTPNGHKISIMLEELGVPYELHPVNIGKGEQFEPAFLKISPNNRIPAIVDPDGPGGRPISVFESGAILQYLGRKYRPLLSRRTSAPGSQVEEWLFWQVGGLGPMTGQANHFLNYAKEDLPYAKKRYTDEVHRLFGVMNRRLATRKFLAGTYSIADIACWSWVLSGSKYHAAGRIPPSQGLARPGGHAPGGAARQGAGGGAAQADDESEDPVRTGALKSRCFGHSAPRRCATSALRD